MGDGKDPECQRQELLKLADRVAAGDIVVEIKDNNTVVVHGKNKSKKKKRRAKKRSALQQQQEHQQPQKMEQRHHNHHQKSQHAKAGKHRASRARPEVQGNSTQDEVVQGMPATAQANNVPRRFGHYELISATAKKTTAANKRSKPNNDLDSDFLPPPAAHHGNPTRTSINSGKEVQPSIPQERRDHGPQQLDDSSGFRERRNRQNQRSSRDRCHQHRAIGQPLDPNHRQQTHWGPESQFNGMSHDRYIGPGKTTSSKNVRRREGSERKPPEFYERRDFQDRRFPENERLPSEHHHNRRQQDSAHRPHPRVRPEKTGLWPEYHEILDKPRHNHEQTLPENDPRRNAFHLDRSHQSDPRQDCYPNRVHQKQWPVDPRRRRSRLECDQQKHPQVQEEDSQTLEQRAPQRPKTVGIIEKIPGKHGLQSPRKPQSQVTKDLDRHRTSLASPQPPAQNYSQTTSKNSSQSDSKQKDLAVSNKSASKKPGMTSKDPSRLAAKAKPSFVKPKPGLSSARTLSSDRPKKPSPTIFDLTDDNPATSAIAADFVIEDLTADNNDGGVNTLDRNFADTHFKDPKTRHSKSSQLPAAARLPGSIRLSGILMPAVQPSTSRLSASPASTSTARAPLRTVADAAAKSTLANPSNLLDKQKKPIAAAKKKLGTLAATIQPLQNSSITILHKRTLSASTKHTLKGDKKAAMSTKEKVLRSATTKLSPGNKDLTRSKGNVQLTGVAKFLAANTGNVLLGNTGATILGNKKKIAVVSIGKDAANRKGKTTSSGSATTSKRKAAAEAKRVSSKHTTSRAAHNDKLKNGTNAHQKRNLAGNKRKKNISTKAQKKSKTTPTTKPALSNSKKPPQSGLTKKPKNTPAYSVASNIPAAPVGVNVFVDPIYTDEEEEESHEFPIRWGGVFGGEIAAGGTENPPPEIQTDATSRGSTKNGRNKISHDVASNASSLNQGVTLFSRSENSGTSTSGGVSVALTQQNVSTKHEPQQDDEQPLATANDSCNMGEKTTSSQPLSIKTSVKSEAEDAATAVKPQDDSDERRSYAIQCIANDCETGVEKWGQGFSTSCEGNVDASADADADDSSEDDVPLVSLRKPRGVHGTTEASDHSVDESFLFDAQNGDTDRLASLPNKGDEEHAFEILEGSGVSLDFIVEGDDEPDEPDEPDHPSFSKPETDAEDVRMDDQVNSSCDKDYTDAENPIGVVDVETDVLGSLDTYDVADDDSDEPIGIIDVTIPKREDELAKRVERNSPDAKILQPGLDPNGSPPQNDNKPETAFVIVIDVDNKTTNDIEKNTSTSENGQSIPARPTAPAEKNAQGSFLGRNDFVHQPAPSTKKKCPAPFQQFRYTLPHHDNAAALEEQERLLRSAAARMQSHAPRVMVSQNLFFVRSKFMSVMPDIAQRYPDHWKWTDNPEGTLGLPSSGVTASEIKSQYKRLARLYHPDKSGTDTTAAKFHAITIAYRKLMGHLR